LLQIHSYGEITILDVSGNILLSTDKLPLDVSDLQPLMRAAMAQKQPVVGNMRWDTRQDGSAKYISVPIAAPLIASGEDKRIVGVLLILADANQFLFPLIQSWPTSAMTAETLLLRRDGNDVLFLNELRNKKDTALRLRIPADHPTVLAAQAARGASGFISGTDYRGEPVIGYASRVPGTDWLMIAKIDADEVYAPIRYIAAIIATAIFALLLVAGIILFMWWRNRNAQYQSSHLQAELDQQLLSQQFDYLSRYANDIILLLDEGGNIVEANERAETSYGLSRLELLGRNIRELHASADRESFDQHWDEIKRNKRLLYEGSYIRNDGSQFPAEVNSRLIETGQGIFVQSIIRDITERKAAQARELRLTNIYRALGETNNAIIHLDSEAGLFPLVCRIAVEYGGMMHAWVGIPDAGNRFVPVASHGKAPAYLENISISAAGDAPEGKGPTGIAFREGKTAAANNFPVNELTAPWAEKAKKHGINSASAFPFVRNGKPYAVFSVYSDYADAFDEEIVQLLEEMTGNISFALDNIDRQNLRLQAETALRHSEERLKGFYNAGLLGVIYWNILGRITGANDKFLEIVGYTREDMLMERISWLDMTPPEYRAQDTQAIQELNESGLHQPFEKEYIRKDGTRIPVMVAGAMLKDSFSEGVAFVMDITERKKSEVEIKLAAMVYRDSSEAMMVTDADRNIIAVNPAFEHITGYKNDEVIGRNLRVLKSDRHDGLFYHAMWKEIYTSGRWKGELWNRKKNGELFAAQLSINTILKEDGSHHRYVGLLSDITEKKQSEDLIWTQANFDNLTGLPNRRMFRDHLQQEIRKSQRSQTPLALMFLDLDGFKYVNDTLGHDMGDILLKEAAQRLNGCMRASDSVARLGGDEFTVILSELHDPGNVDRVARHILKTLSDPFQLGEEIVHVSASIGITLYPNDSTEIEDLIKNADQAMYAAKQEGKNRFHYFTPALQELAIAKMRLVNDLRSALNENQFEIVYQPIVELVTGTIHKAEALIRWQHPTRGLINPVEFISTAEDTGMIASFGNWIFHEAASQASQWRNKYHAAFQISVNISPVQFRNEGIDSSNWLDRLQELGLPGQGVVVEITEGLLLDASTKVTDQLLMLRDAGIEVALDDFGTGYSSLSYLKKFDIDYLKIDQSFVRNLTPDSDDLALCEAIIVMAHKLGIKVIAEGIETKEQGHLLASAGCDYGQGYLFSRPLPKAEFEFLLNKAPGVTNLASAAASASG